MSTPITPNQAVNLPEDILAASAKGTLVDILASYPHQEHESLARSLAELHNAGLLDVFELFGTACRKATHPGFTFFRIQQIFCSTLPRVECSVKAAADACNDFMEEAGPDHAASFVYDSFLKWLGVNCERIEQGLSLVQTDQNIHSNATQSVLIAGAAHDPNRFAAEALKLSQDTQPSIRLGALRALGKIGLERTDCTLDRVMERLDEVIASPLSDEDAAAAVETALNLAERNGARLSGAVESIIRKSNENPSQNTRRAIAFGLQIRRESLTDGMIDAMLEALQNADIHDPNTIHRIDLALAQWDLEGDRDRVLLFLKELLSGGEAAIDISRLDSFKYALAERHDDLAAWYAVSLLLTGNDRLCLAASHLLSPDKANEGLDIDLTPFALSGPQLLFLSRKILGYFTFQKITATALLLSCLRAVPEEARTELEDLLLNMLLINFPGAMKLLKAAVTAGGPAEKSVKGLSGIFNTYFEGIERSGSCDAFQPSERARQIQSQLQMDFYRTVWKETEKKSPLFDLVPRSTLLYGSASILYKYSGEDSEPQRCVVPLMSFGQEVEIPRLPLIDPVGLESTIRFFRLEPPPS